MACHGNDNFFTLYTSESFPPLTTPVDVLTSGQSKLIKFRDVDVVSAGQVLIEGNFIFGSSEQGITATVDILRDGKSIINGPQIIDGQTGSTLLPADIIRTNTSTFSIVDNTVCPGCHSYLIIVNNASPNGATFQIETYTVNIKAFDEAKIFATQVIPVSGTPALTLAAGQTSSIVLTTDICEAAVRLNVNLNVIFALQFANLSIDILRADNTSVIGGPKVFLETTTGVTAPALNYESLILSVFDPTPSLNYTLKLINNQSVISSIGFYSFNAESFSQIDQGFGVKQVFPLTSTPVLTIPASGFISIPVKLVTSKDQAVQLSFNGSVSGTATANILLFNITRDEESLNNGEQILARLNFGGIITFLQSTQSILAVDPSPSSGKTRYILDIYNLGSGPVDLDFYAFIAEQSE